MLINSTDLRHPATHLGGPRLASLDDPFTAAVLALVEERGGHWRGPAEGLLKHINSVAGTDFDRPAWWPRNARAVTVQCEKASEALRHAGVVFHKGKANGARYVELTGTQN